MGIILTKTIVNLCGGEACEGFALIKMIPPTGYHGTILDTITGKSYPNNLIVKAPINSTTGTWVSCELPFSDQLSPKCYYEVAEVIRGDSLDNCVCTDACNCYKYVDPQLPTTKVWLSSTAGLVSPVQLTDVSSSADSPELCDYLREIYGGCVPQTVSFTLSTEHFDVDAAQTPLTPWYAYAAGNVKLDFAAIRQGTTVHNAALHFEVVSLPGGTVKYTGQIALAAVKTDITLAAFAIAAGEGLTVRVIAPEPSVVPPALYVQGRLLIDL